MTKPDGVVLKASDFKKNGDKLYIDTAKTRGLSGMLLVWGDFCGHCHHFLPTFNNIVSKVQNAVSCVSIESEEFTGNESIAKALRVEGYPSIYFFDNNGMILYMYRKGRDTSSILNEICKNFHHCVKQK